MGWILGTLVLWGLKLITMPLAKIFAGDKMRSPTPTAPEPPEPVSEEGLPDVGGEQKEIKPAKPKEVIPTGPYILADVIVLGVAGFLLGLLTGSYFIGFSWKARDWPGMIVFILTSFVGSAIHG